MGPVGAPQRGLPDGLIDCPGSVVQPQPWLAVGRNDSGPLTLAVAQKMIAAAQAEASRYLGSETAALSLLVETEDLKETPWTSSG
jgi:hypothetical protein